MSLKQKFLALSIDFDLYLEWILAKKHSHTIYTHIKIGSTDFAIKLNQNCMVFIQIFFLHIFQNSALKFYCRSSFFDKDSWFLINSQLVDSNSNALIQAIFWVQCHTSLNLFSKAISWKNSQRDYSWSQLCRTYSQRRMKYTVQNSWFVICRGYNS